MAEKKFDIPKEPSVTSADPKERILARRLRIQRRFEALKKHEGIDDEAIVEKNQIEKQIEASEEVLEKLIDEGDEVVTNVRVANDAREVQRRNEDIAIRNEFLRKLEDEADESLKKYQAVNEKWSGILESKDPLDIHEGIQSQSTKCQDILKQKEALIEELKQELERADEKFCADQKKQNEDINLLIERIDNQVNAIAKAYRRELVLIEDAVNSERKALLETVTKKWDSLFEQRCKEEVNGVERRKAIMREYENEMSRVMIENQEKCRSEKIELETECQNLQQEVQTMKAICLMNIEKLNYNYAVLKLREDENTIVKNQQKRRMNKLQDVLNDLKKTFNELENGTRLEIEKLTDQVHKAHKNIAELEVKSQHFTRVNDKRFLDIWDMNTRKADEMLEKILTADRLIHEQTLSLEWEPPELKLLKKEDLPSYAKAIAEIERGKIGIETGLKIFQDQEKPTNLKDSNAERRLLNHILTLISDHTGYLIEDKLRELLIPHTRYDNIIIRLDNVFQALEIVSEEQVDLLTIFFLPYSYCPTCTNDADLIADSKCENGEFAIDDIHEGKVSLEQSQLQKNGIDGEIAEETQNMSETIEESRAIDASSSSSSATRKVTCKKGHILEIESANVSRALREFAEKQQKIDVAEPSNMKENLLNQKLSTTVSRSLTNDDIINYWTRYRDIFSKDREKLWDGLLIGLHKYHDILKERHKLNNETESLRKQNSELRRLLESHAVKVGNRGSTIPGQRAFNKSA